MTIVYVTTEYHSHQHRNHAYVPSSRMDTGPWVFFGTQPLPFRQILRDLPMGFFRNPTFALPADSVRSIDYSVSDNRVEFTGAPTQ